MRFVVPLAIVLAAKLVGGLILYQVLGMERSNTYWMSVSWNNHGQNQVLSAGASTGAKWPYLFLGWDSAWYLSIAEKGYTFSDQSYAFFPGLPLLIRLADQVFHDPSVSAVSLSILLGMAWIPLFQLVAEAYMDRGRALGSALLCSFLPYVFLFTTVVYGEGLFLLSSLGAWVLLKRGRVRPAMLVASMAVVTRPTGLVILLPALIEILRVGGLLRRRSLLYALIPVSCFFAWLSYCGAVFGDWYAPFNRSEWNNMRSLPALSYTVVFQGKIEALSESMQTYPFPLSWAIFLPLTILLIYYLSKMDRSLSFYSTAYFLGIVAFGALASVPRFMSFLFPIWLPLTSRLVSARHSKLLTLLTCVSFYLVGLFLWYSFLNGEFVS